MGNEETCPICTAKEVRYHQKILYPLEAIQNTNQLVKFYVAGMGSNLYTMYWGNLSQHCPYGTSLPRPAYELFPTFLSDDFMDNAYPQISYMSAQKHPLVFGVGEAEIPHGLYLPAPVKVKELKLHLVFAGTKDEQSPAIAIPADPKYFRQVPRICLGTIEDLQLTMAALTELVLPKYPAGTDLAFFAGRKACLLDAKVSFALVEGGGEENQSLFDGGLFHPNCPEEVPVETPTSLLLHRDYLRHLSVA